MLKLIVVIKRRDQPEDVHTGEKQMRMNEYITIVIFLMFGALSNADDSFSITPVVVEGDNVPGVGVIEFIDNLAINDSGDWFVEANTSFPNTDEDQVLLKNGVVLLREGVGGLSAPPMSFVDSFDSVSINNNGSGGFNFFIDPFPFTEDSGIYIDTTLLFQESDIATAPEFSPGTPYIGFFDTKINDNDSVMVIASVDDPAINSSVDRAIVLVDSMSQTVVAKEGDILPGQTESVEDFGTGPHESAYNNNGNVLYVAELTGDTSTDQAIYLNQTLIAQEGSPSPSAGRTYDLLSSRGLDINDSDEFVFKANLSGDTANDEVIVKNSTIFKSECDPAPGGFSFTGFGTTSGPVKIDNAGNVLWFGEWDDPNGDIDSGLFLNDTLLVQEGVTEIGGLMVDTVNAGTDAFSMSDNGEWILFEATLDGGVNGAFAIQFSASAGIGDVQSGR